MLKYILILLTISLISIPSFADATTISISTDKTEYYKDEPIFVSGIITEIDWSEDITIDYIIKDVKNIFQLGIGENVTTLNDDGTFSFTIDFLERESWVSYLGNITFFITSQNATTNIRLYISDQLNMSNEYLYEKSINHEERISFNNSTLSTHDIMLNNYNTRIDNNDLMVNEHSQNFISHDGIINALLETISTLQQQIVDQSISFSALQQQVDGLRDLVQGEAPISDDTPIPVISNFTVISTGNGIVSLSWDIENDPITLYNLIYRAEVGVWSTEFVLVNATTHTITDLENIEYDFKFSAENEFGESRIEKFSLIP